VPKVARIQNEAVPIFNGPVSPTSSRSSRCISSTSSAVSVIQMLFRVSWTWAPTVGSNVLMGFIGLVFTGLFSS
jgi:hypothetical protein